MAVEPLMTRIDEGHAPACRLYLVRHGTTVMNVQNRYRGRRDIPLDAQGYQDAVDAARRLSRVGVTAVYTGPLRRTIATAQIIADATEVPDLRILHGLNNLDYGDWEGMTSEEAAAHNPEAHFLYRTSPNTAVCPNGERLLDAQRRMIAAIKLIGDRHPGEAVVAVTHAVMIRLTLVALNGVEGESWRQPIGRGSVTEFHVDGTIQLASLPQGDEISRQEDGLALPAIGESRLRWATP
jgi:broad specificity phosphatase PhoE